MGLIISINIVYVNIKFICNSLSFQFQLTIVIRKSRFHHLPCHYQHPHIQLHQNGFPSVFHNRLHLFHHPPHYRCLHHHHYCPQFHRLVYHHYCPQFHCLHHHHYCPQFHCLHHHHYCPQFHGLLYHHYVQPCYLLFHHYQCFLS